jgi:hypothetical protein
MRAAILGLSALIVLLSASIVVEITARASAGTRRGMRFDAARMLADARVGEQVVYREQGGRRRRLAYAVTAEWPETIKRVPTKEIEVLLSDPREPADRARRAVYEHRLTDHFWFPLMEPRAPEELDRVWILRAIRRDDVLVGNETRACWRVDLIDPALPEDAEHVTAWMDTSVPVFGMLKWKRGETVWELETAKEAP